MGKMIEQYTIKIPVCLFVIFVWANQVFAHSGGLDSNGGHYNRKTGVYHCHRCPCGCPDEVNKSISPSTPMRERPKSSSENIISQTKNAELRLCTKVIDGDTIVLDDKEKVRLIGVDTPETVHTSKPVEFFGKEASAFTKKMVEDKKVKLEYDQQRTDKYGRTLAYVYLEDGTFVNAEIIKQGYGFAYTKFPFKYMDAFRRYEREAMENKMGLWADR